MLPVGAGLVLLPLGDGEPVGDGDVLVGVGVGVDVSVGVGVGVEVSVGVGVGVGVGRGSMAHGTPAFATVGPAGPRANVARIVAVVARTKAVVSALPRSQEQDMVSSQIQPSVPMSSTAPPWGVA